MNLSFMGARRGAPLRGYWTARSGAVAMFVATIGNVLLLTAVAGSEYAQAIVARDKLQSVLDSAVLAGLRQRLITGSDAEAARVVEAFWESGAAALEYAPSSLGAPEIDAADGLSLRAEATAQIDTSILSLIGLEVIPVEIASEAVVTQGAGEVVVAIDLSGSMANNRRIDRAEEAARDFVEQAQTLGTRVGFAPWQSTVNIGTGPRAERLLETEFDLADYDPVGWRGCVLLPARIDPTAPPPARPFTPFMSASDAYNVYPPFDEAARGGPGPNRSCIRQALTPLTDDFRTLNAAIDAFDARDDIGAGTASELGVIFGTLMLSEHWAPALCTEGVCAAPAPFGDPNIGKALILLTDGGNGFPYAWPGDGATVDEPNTGPTSYQRIDLQTAASGSVQASVDARTQAACDRAKALGVRVVTVMYDFETPAAEALLRGCASRPGDFYMAEPADLSNVFQEIQGQLAQIRLVR